MWQQIESNKRKTFLVILAMNIFLIMFGLCCAIMITNDIAEIIFLNLIFYAIFIGMFIYGYTRPLSSFGENIYEYFGEDDKTLQNVVHEMQIASGLGQMPKIYILDSNILNAFACGTNEKNAKIVVTKGLLKTLNRDELQGVIAHEIAHIVNKDTCYLLYASIIVNIVANFANFYFRNTLRSRRSSKTSQADAALLIVAIIFMILAPILASMFYFFLSRKREYLADACSAQFTRYPEGLASALRKISKAVEEPSNCVMELDEISSPLAQASYIVPLKSNKEKDGLFSTHPSTENRINILLSMANMQRADFEAYNNAFEEVTDKKIIKLSNDEIKNIPLRAADASCVMGLTGGAVAAKDKENIDNEIKNHRNIENMMWNLAHYINIDCPCGTKLRIPPSYIGQTITCPHCKQPHEVKGA